MASILVNWVLSALAILVVSNVVAGFMVDSFQTALIVALVLGIANAIIKPILTVLTLPINILTLGLFTFVINALLLLGVSLLVPGFTIIGFGPALAAAVVLWLINLIINLVLFPIKAV
ncbi:phage holin family protein [Candidatus Curtissbacteria bacterium]|nr:phage holin family protein [Candidatus Curtissbacteria bacterium]